MVEQTVPTVRPRLLRILPPKPCGAISKPKFRLLPPKPPVAISKPKFKLLPPKPLPRIKLLAPKPGAGINKPKPSIRLTLSKRKLAKPQLCREIQKRWKLEEKNLRQNYMSERPKIDYQQQMDRVMRKLAAIAGYHQRRVSNVFPNELVQASGCQADVDQELPTTTAVETMVRLPNHNATYTKRSRVVPMTWNPAALNIPALLANTPVAT